LDRLLQTLQHEEAGSLQQEELQIVVRFIHSFVWCGSLVQGTGLNVPLVIFMDFIRWPGNQITRVLALLCIL
jgi:hypothetical protein